MLSKAPKKESKKGYLGIFSSFYLLILIVICFRPVSGLHAFRQAQTNWPVKLWIENGFSPFNPQLPIKGIGYTNWILEFPLYQWITYLIVKVTAFSVDSASRLQALIWAIVSVYLFSKTLDRLTRFNTNQIFLLLTFNPFFIYWSTTGLIDWLAVGLGTISTYLYINSKTSAERSKYRTFIFQIASIFLFSAAFIVKPTHAIIAYFVLCILSFVEFGSKFIFINNHMKILVPALVFYVTWNRWVGSLYGPSDPRSIWNVDKSNLRGYFGFREQYESLFNFLQYILIRFLNSSFGLISFIVFAGTLIVISEHHKWKTLVLVVLSFGYCSVFLNLNINHQYYQIPLLYSLGAAFVLGVNGFSKSFGSREMQNGALVLILIFHILSVGASGDAKAYVNGIVQKSNSNNQCPKDSEITGTVISWGIEQPDIFYECNLKSYQSYFENERDIEALNKHKIRYKYLHFQVIPDENSKERMKKLLDATELIEIEPNWFRIAR